MDSNPNENVSSSQFTVTEAAVIQNLLKQISDMSIKIAVLEAYVNHLKQSDTNNINN